MDLRSITYTSRANLNASARDIEAIHRTARELNSLDGISGLLIFNGVHFLQIVEGTVAALDDLIRRLRDDPRHSHFEIHDDRYIDEQSFAGWSMQLVRVSAGYFEARETIEDCIPATIPNEVRARIYRLTRDISGTVQIP